MQLVAGAKNVIHESSSAHNLYEQVTICCSCLLDTFLAEHNKDLVERQRYPKIKCSCHGAIIIAIAKYGIHENKGS